MNQGARKLISQLDSVDRLENPLRFRTALLELLSQESCQPKTLLEMLSRVPRIAQLYAMDSGTGLKMTIAQHTLLVLAQFEKYFAKQKQFGFSTRASLRLMLALHDIGKALPRNPYDQHRETLMVIQTISEYLPWNEDQFRGVIALIGSDPLGSYLQECVEKSPSAFERRVFARRAALTRPNVAALKGYARLTCMQDKSNYLSMRAKQTALLIRSRVHIAGVPLDSYLKCQFVYFQADTAAYTIDAKCEDLAGKPGLEHLYALNNNYGSEGDEKLFQIDAKTQLLRFSAQVQPCIRALVNALQA